MSRRALFLTWILNLWTPLFLTLVFATGVWVGMGTALVALFLIPPLLCRALFASLGRPEGRFEPGSRGYLIWFASYQLQLVFNRFPSLDELLRLVPGLYSTWLRLWGAEVGKLAFWTPRSRVLDRGYLVVGDFVVIGFEATISSHFYNATHEMKTELVLAPVKIGSRVVVGAGSGLSPGVEIAPGEMVTTMVQITPFHRWAQGRKHRLN